MSDFIPDYSRYSVRQLVDVYQRIEKEKYPNKVKIIKEQIHTKLNLDKSIDIDSVEFQKLFESILSEGFPLKAPKIKNVALGEKIDKVGWIFLGLSIIFFVTDTQFKNSNLGILGMLFFTLFITANAIQSYFTGVIHIKVISIKECEKPTQFAIFQAMYFFLALLCLLAIIRWFTS
jgi:hypothetical protein